MRSRDTTPFRIAASPVLIATLSVISILEGAIELFSTLRKLFARTARVDCKHVGVRARWIGSFYPFGSWPVDLMESRGWRMALLMELVPIAPQCRRYMTSNKWASPDISTSAFAFVGCTGRGECFGHHRFLAITRDPADKSMLYEFIRSPEKYSSTAVRQPDQSS